MVGVKQPKTILFDDATLRKVMLAVAISGGTFSHWARRVLRVEAEKLIARQHEE